MKGRRIEDMKEVNEGRTWLISHGEEVKKSWGRMRKQRVWKFVTWVNQSFLDQRNWETK